jgi:hypothetical protein
MRIEPAGLQMQIEPTELSSIDLHRVLVKFFQTCAAEKGDRSDLLGHVALHRPATGEGAKSLELFRGKAGGTTEHPLRVPPFPR